MVNMEEDQVPSESVCVAVHCRPLIESELEQGCSECLLITPGQPQIQHGNQMFTYDHVFGGDGGEDPVLLYDATVAPLIDSLFKGLNATVFAYGQTGSGKTYTMGSSFPQWSNDSGYQGIIPRAMDSIFSRIKQTKDVDFTVRVGFVEIHKEDIRDLLSPKPVAHSVHIRELPSGGIVLAGATEKEVRSLSEMMQLLEQGTLLRSTAETGMNKRSSRSHAIFTVTVEQRRINSSIKTDIGSLREKNGLHLNGFEAFSDEEDDDDMTEDPESVSEDNEEEDNVDGFLCAKIHLVDLAGSERAKRTKAHGARLQEGININRGLLALGNVINALSEGKSHVPYRDSKLTRMLQDSLGGNSRTLMISCVSPADVNLEETLNTLRYASRARAIKNRPVVNRDPISAQIAALRQQITVLRQENYELRQRLGIARLGSLKDTGSIESASEDYNSSKANVATSAWGSQRGSITDSEVTSGKPKSKCEVGSDNAREILLAETHPNLGVTSTRETHYLEIGDESEYHTYSCKVADNDSHIASKHQTEMTAYRNELDVLQRQIEKKEAEVNAMASHAVMKKSYREEFERIQAERDALAKERRRLLEKLDSLKSSSVEERIRMERKYTERLREVEARVKNAERKERQIVQLENAKNKAIETIKVLERDIVGIKAQRVALQKQAEKSAKDFAAWRREREREVLRLKKEGRANSAKLQRIQALHDKQKEVLKRKTEEAAAARKKLQMIENRRCGSQRSNQSESKELGSESISQLESSYSDIRSNAEKENRISDFKNVEDTKLADSEPKAEKGPAVWPKDMQELNSMNISSLKKCIETELESCTSTYDLQKVLEGEKALRSNVSRQLRKVERRLAAIRNPDWWGGSFTPGTEWDERSLLTKREKLKAASEEHSKQIQEIQLQLIRAREEEEKRGEGAADISRWTFIPGGNGLHQTLCALFLSARQYKSQVYEADSEILELKEEVDMLRLKLQVVEAEKLEVMSQNTANMHAAENAVCESTDSGTPVGDELTMQNQSILCSDDNDDKAHRVIEILNNLVEETEQVKEACNEALDPSESDKANGDKSPVQETSTKSWDTENRSPIKTPVRTLFAVPLKDSDPNSDISKSSENKSLEIGVQEIEHKAETPVAYVEPEHSSPSVDDSCTSSDDSGDEWDPSSATPLSDSSLLSETNSVRHLLKRENQKEFIEDVQEMEKKVLEHLNKSLEIAGEPPVDRCTKSALRSALTGLETVSTRTRNKIKWREGSKSVRDMITDYYNMVICEQSNHLGKEIEGSLSPHVSKTETPTFKQSNEFEVSDARGEHEPNSLFKHEGNKIKGNMDTSLGTPNSQTKSRSSIGSLNAKPNDSVTAMTDSPSIAKSASPVATSTPKDESKENSDQDALVFEVSRLQNLSIRSNSPTARKRPHSASSSRDRHRNTSPNLKTRLQVKANSITKKETRPVSAGSHYDKALRGIHRPKRTESESLRSIGPETLNMMKKNDPARKKKIWIPG